MSHFEQLLKAARDGDKGKVISIFEALLEDYKHDLSMRTRAISETASKAAEYSHPKILKWCFSQGFTLPEESYEHPFHMAACWSQSTAVWQVLLDNDFDLNRHETEYLGNALIQATEWGNVIFTKFLLENGRDPNINASSHFGELDVLTYSIAGQHPSHEVLQLLLQHGADIRGKGAAIAAAEVGRLDDLKLLVEYGADLEEVEQWWLYFRDDDGDMDEGSAGIVGTALYRACRRGRVNTAKYLLDLGADGHARDEAGTSCYAIAADGGHQEIVKLLRRTGILSAELNTPIVSFESRSAEAEMLNRLLADTSLEDTAP